MPSRWKAPDVAEEGDERSGDQKPDAGDGSQVLDGGQLLGRGLELAFHLFDSCLDLADLSAGFGEDRPQSLGQIRVGILDEGPHRRHDLTRAHGDEDAQFAKETTQGIESRRALRHPARAQSVERGKHLLPNRLDGYGPDVFVAASFQDALGVGAVGLVAADVWADVVRRKKDDAMPEALDLPSPVVGRSAGLHDDGGCRLLGHEGEELSSGQTLTAQHVAWSIGDPDLENSLCHVHGDASIVRHDGLLLCLDSSDSGTSMPTESQEKSISSMQQTSHG